MIGLARTHTHELRTYALDRIIELAPTKEKFTYPKRFSPEGFFSNCYGIFHTDDKPSFVKLKVTASQALYLDTLPLHRSQRRVDEESTDKYVIYEYFMSPAYDFIQYLASKAASIEVLESQELREEVAEEVKRMYKTYFR